MRDVQYKISDVKTRAAGKTAWATFKYTITTVVKDRHVDSSRLGTAVLEWRKEAWKIVHWHTSSSRKPVAGLETP